MNKYCRIILSGKSDPFFNMACDEYMLTLFERLKTPVFRIYGWEPSCISIGYNQDPLLALDGECCKAAGIPFVRRITGGSAIYHDDEITYSLVMSDNSLEKHSSFRESYGEICRFIHASYAVLGLESFYSREDPKFGSLKGRTNFCFSSWEDYDITIGGRKIGGNAQKRRKDIILQHGSIPFSLDYELIDKMIRDTPPSIKNRTTSLNELLDGPVNFNRMQDIMIDSIEKTFGLEARELILTDEDRSGINSLADGKYKSVEWNHNRICKKGDKNGQ